MTATIEAGSGIGIATLSIIAMMTVAVGFLFWCLFSFVRELIRAKQWRLRRWELAKPSITEVCSLPSPRRHLHIVISGQRKEAFRRRVAI